MNKIGMVLGVAAVVSLAGCKDPDYKYGSDNASQNEVKNVETVPAAPAPVVVEKAPAKKCACLPGTKHTAPCACGAADCKCVVEKPIVIVADTSKPAPASAPAPVAKATTTYIVQRGDSLSKISKKFNITIAAIKRANPKIKNDVVWIGQRLQLPGQVDVGVQTVPEGAFAKPAKKAYAAYSGATKEYVVKSGDTLGAIAYGNGISIRQLKELNGISGNSIRIGQKLKIPAEKVVAAKPAPKAAAKKPANKAATPAPAPVEAKKAVEAPASAAEAPAAAEQAKPVEQKPAAEAPAAEAAPAPAEAPAAAAEPQAEALQTSTYVVQEGDDLTGVSIRFGISAAVIRELNNLPDEAQLVPGQVIKLPAEAQQ